MGNGAPLFLRFIFSGVAAASLGGSALDTIAGALVCRVSVGAAGIASAGA